MKKIYAIKDAEMGYSTVFVAPNDAMAKRIFKATVNDEGNYIHEEPEKFRLMCLAKLDENNGICEPNEEFVENANNVLVKK